MRIEISGIGMILIIIAIIVGLFPPDPPKKKKKKKKMEDYSIIEICSHDISEIRVIRAACGCETTAEFCTECGEQLTEPKTDC